ncbi:hypothetical protein GGX14DRAFT_657808, partial [Mycena pura]
MSLLLRRLLLPSSLAHTMSLVLISSSMLTFVVVILPQCKLRSASVLNTSQTSLKIKLNRPMIPLIILPISIMPRRTASSMFMLLWSGRSAPNPLAPMPVRRSNMKQSLSPGLSTSFPSHVDFIPVALGAQNYENRYVAGVASGPMMKISWAGLP